MEFREQDHSWQGHSIHTWRGGRGKPLLLLHGSGPGASTLGNWSRVLKPLAERFDVLAADLIGFGLSSRKKEPPYFDLQLWQAQASFLVDQIGRDDIGVLGHSLSGALVLKLAAGDGRITGVVTTGTVGAPDVFNNHLKRIWTFPKTRQDLLAALDVLVYDKSLITDTFVDQRMSVLSVPGYGEYFDSMFGGDKKKLIDSAIIDGETLKSIRQKVLLVHGLNDLPVPWQTSVRLAQALPSADVLLLNRCSHSPALEHPEKLVSAVIGWLAG
jgi:2-hydroxymuconate-semialdehyde hydrolase